MNHRSTVLFVSLAILSGPLSAQVTRQLTNPEVFPESFGMISGIRELSDGRLLLADPLGQALAVLNLALGTADTIGGVGGGPEEYRQPDRLFPLPGDSTLLTDLGNGRLTILGPNLEFASTMPITRPGAAGPRMSGGVARAGRNGQPGTRMVRGGPPGGGPTFVLPQAVDREGRIYFRLMSMGGMEADSGYVGRWDRTTDKIDTVASFRLQEMKRETSGGANNQSVMIRPMPYSPQDDWTVGPNGRIAVVRAGEYRLDWVSNKSISSGPEVDYRPVRVRRPEQEAWLAAGSDGISIGVEMNNGQMQTSFGRGGGNGRPSRGEINSYDWPNVLPAFRSGRAQVAPDGSVWVERYQAAGEPMQFDVFDGQGRLTANVKVGAGRRLLGFGSGVVYLAARDEFDLEYLEQYQLPATR